MLRKALPKTQVYVSSVPDLKRLWSEGRSNPLGKQIWKAGYLPLDAGRRGLPDHDGDAATRLRCRTGWRRTTRS